MYTSKKYQTGVAMPVVIVVVVILLGLGVGGYLYFSPRGDRESIEKVEIPPKAIEHEAAVGEEVRLETFLIIAEKIEETDVVQNGYPFNPGEAVGIVKAKSGMKFVLAKIDINNIANSAIIVLSDKFILRDDSRREYKTLDHESELLRGFNYYVDKTELEVGGGVLGFIAFEVPEGVTDYKLFIREESATRSSAPSTQAPSQVRALTSPLVGIWKPVKSYSAGLLGQDWQELKPQTAEEKVRIEKEYLQFTNDGRMCTGEPKVGSGFECRVGETAYQTEGNRLITADIPDGQRIKWEVEGNTLELIIEGKSSDGLWVPFIKSVLTRYQ